MNQELTHEIVRRYHEGQSARSIARDLQISRERVRRALAGHHRAGPVREFVSAGFRRVT